MLHKFTRFVRLVIFSIFFLHFLHAEASVSVSVYPGDQTVSVGEQVVFGATVTATAGEVITGYEWWMSTNNQSFAMVGNSASLVLNNVQTNNAGYYYVSVTYGPVGSQQTVSSKTVTLVVNLQPQIATQPVSLTLPVGSNAVFSVVVGGEPPLHMQWQKNGSNLANSSRVTGATSTTLEIQNLAATDSGNYDVVLTNSYGSATSQVATLDVIVYPPVLTSPTNAIGKQGYSFNYTISATGTEPITFGASGLPAGLTVNSTSGLISGIPTVFGDFDVTLFATNALQTTTGNLFLTLADDIPVITSVTNATGQQGQLFSYTITATNDPVLFSATPLPEGLSVDKHSGIISGVPLVSGPFSITIGAANAYGSDSETLTLNLASGAPTITSSLQQNGTQGQSLSYTITTHNNASSFSAVPLPDGLNLDASSGVISGVPLVSGTFPVTIGAANQFGSDSQTLTFNIGSGVPVITSSLSVTDGEDEVFDYIIAATNSPTDFWASDLPTGLTVNTNTGEITGSPLYAGNYSIPLFAANAWGVGTATLELTVTNIAITNLVITNVVSYYSTPYLLDFRFSLLDGADPMTSHAVVASPTLMSVSAFENGVQVSPSETSVLLQRVDSQSSQATSLQGYLVLDFSDSIATSDNGELDANGVPDAIDAEVASAQSFVNEQPPGSQVGVFEFHRDDETPQLVQPLTANTNVVDNAIAGIWNNYVQGFPAGSRAWDALLAAINTWGTNAFTNQIHYILFMSDGGDDSSVASMNQVITAATNDNVRIFTVGIGDDVDTNALETLADSTLGQYIPTNSPDLIDALARIGKDLSSQYILRWATLDRSSNSFMPTFQISYQSLNATSPPNPIFISGTNFVVVTNSSGVVMTNATLLYMTNYIIPYFTPSAYAGNVLAGSLLLVTNAYVNPPEITLQAFYVPRYIRQIHLHYRANWPVAVTMDSTNPGEILYGWTLTQTNDGAGGQWAYLSAPNPSLLSESIPFADFGDLLSFSFEDASAVSNAFSLFTVDNTIYTNTTGTNFYGFVLTNTNPFTAVYALPPPHGTPIPWLMSYGFTGNFAADELLDPNNNGLAVWQDYLAGLNPNDPNSKFAVQIASLPNPPQIAFSTAVNRTYRIEWSEGVDGPWAVLRDGIAGTGGEVIYTDDRNLSGVSTMYYRVVVEYP